MREKRARKAKATKPKQTNMGEKEGKRMVGVHHLGAEKSGATRPSQARPGQRRVSGYATIWGAKHGTPQRREEREDGQIKEETIGRQRGRERKEGPRRTSAEEGRRSSIVVEL